MVRLLIQHLNKATVLWWMLNLILKIFVSDSWNHCDHSLLACGCVWSATAQAVTTVSQRCIHYLFVIVILPSLQLYWANEHLDILLLMIKFLKSTIYLGIGWLNEITISSLSPPKFFFYLLGKIGHYCPSVPAMDRVLHVPSFLEISCRNLTRKSKLISAT